MSDPEITQLASPPGSTPWVPLWPLSPSIPTPVDGQWLKASGGAMVWSAIGLTDLPVYTCGMFYRMTTQAIPTASETVVDVATAGVTSGMTVDISANRIVAITSGIYLLNAYVSFATNTTGMRGVRLRANSGNQAFATQLPISSGLPTEMTISCISSLAANDYLDFSVYQDSGASLNLNWGQLAVTRMK